MIFTALCLAYLLLGWVRLRRTAIYIGTYRKDLTQIEFILGATGRFKDVEVKFKRAELLYVFLLLVWPTVYLMPKHEHLEIFLENELELEGDHAISKHNNFKYKVVAGALVQFEI